VTDIEDQEELLHRQVNPGFFQDEDQPTSQVFRPTRKDEGRLSVSAGSRASAEESLRRYNERGCGSSCGVLSVTVEECSSLELAARYDPLGEDDPAGPDDAHAVVDFNGLDKSQHKKKGKALLLIAMNRGWTYRPDAEAAGA
jgi:hypothetical protein